MANYQKCSQGHYYDADRDTVCPICKSGRGSYAKISWAIAGLAVLIAAFLFYTLEETKTNLENAGSLKKCTVMLQMIITRINPSWY